MRSKQRVRDYGEVFTPEWLVKEMLDMVKDEAEKVESRFLEPGCGNGNFLVEILERKLNVVDKKYNNSKDEYRFHIILALSSIYGVEILFDNVEECRNRLIGVIRNHYSDEDQEFFDTVNFILERNIIWGDFLALKYMENGEDIILSEWMGNNYMLLRRDFMFSDLINTKEPQPLKTFEPVNYLKADMI